MTKTLTALTAAVALTAALSFAPSDAFAQRRGAVAAGLLGGLAAGAIIGGAIANSPGYAPAYGPGYVPVEGYVPYAAYRQPYPVACPGGYWARRPMYGPYGQFLGYSAPRFFCP
jgi:hypothetical protein